MTGAHPIEPRHARQLVRQACLAEAILVLAAFALDWLLHPRPPDRFAYSAFDTALATIASLPLLALMVALVRWPVGPARPLRHLVVDKIIPLFRPASLTELAAISILAGVGEELLFRGLLQQWLEGPLGRWWALVLASVLFGLAHCISLGYVLLAGLIGAYLGWLYIATGNLLVPIVTHAVYDFLALVYLTRLPHLGPQPCAASRCSAPAAPLPHDAPAPDTSA